MISKDKTYRTRDGREVRIYATDGHPDEPVHGAFKDKGKWMSTNWSQTGKFCSFAPHDLDLIEVKPRIRRTVWVNLHENDFVTASPTEAFAKQRLQHSLKDALACIRVEIDCEEGEGL